ncbi:MAG: hypothetical protein JNK09_16265, partial [Prolixibacteraceae bacterium]|nr:hypothetical protein [Prolixibacteraceae bacterium]
MQKHRCSILILIISFFVVSCTTKIMTVQEVMDKVVTQLYKTTSAEDLKKLDNESVMKLFSPEDLKSLATQHWGFDVNVPVVVSVMRSAKQKVVPFWLPETGFQKTDLSMKNEQTTYEVWQKSFKAGRVGLGVNGFDQELGMHYFVSVAPQNKEDQLTLSNFFPENQF